MDPVEVYSPPKTRPEKEIKAIEEIAELVGTEGLATSKSEYISERTKNFVTLTKTDFVENFDLQDEIERAPGKLIEVGGPTDQATYLNDITHSGRELIITNLYSGDPIWDENPSIMEPIEYQTNKSIEIITDAVELAFKDASIGLIYASSLPKDIRINFLNESKRVLKDKGLLVLSNFSESNILYALSCGFKILELIRREVKRSNESVCSAVLMLTGGTDT